MVGGKGGLCTWQIAIPKFICSVTIPALGALYVIELVGRTYKGWFVGAIG